MTEPAQPPAVPAAPAEVVVAPVDVPVRKGAALGVAALILGILAFLGDIVFFFILIAQSAAVFASIAGGDLTGLSSLAGYAFIGLTIFVVGGIGALLAVILGLAGAISGRGRVAAVFGIIFGVLVLISRIIVISGLGNISQVFSGS